MDPDVIVGRQERPLPCSSRTLYCLFERRMLDRSNLLMKGKRKPNGHQERRGKQAFRRTLSDQAQDYPAFLQEFGHLEGDTIVGRHHKSAVITLVERLSNEIITLQPAGRTAGDIENTLHRWWSRFPKHMNFHEVDQPYVSAVASRRNQIPRKSLDYCTPLEVFMRYMEPEMLSNSI